MNRSISVFLLLLTVAVVSAPARGQASREATIEPETKARIVLQSQLNSKLNEPGDTVSAVLYEPIYVNGNLVLPRGTEFHGRVTEAAPAGRMQKNGKISIIFERMSMSWGEEPVSVIITAIDDWDTDQKYKADEEGQVDGKRSGRRTAENVKTGGAIGGAAGISTVLLGGGATTGGAVIAGGLLGGLLLTKGGDVKVAPGAVFRIKFTKPITLPVIQQGNGVPRPIQQTEPVTEGAAKKP
jgi:hypothetical protein